MQYLLNYSLTGQIQKYFSLTNPADVQAAACLLIFDLLRFKCTVSQHIHFYFILLFATSHHHHWWLMTKRRNHSISTFPPLALFCMLGLCHTFARPVPLAVPGCHNQLETQWASFRKVYFEARNANTDSQLVENHITLLNPENLAQHECHNTQRSDEIYNSEFHCRGGKKKKKVSLNEALQTERGETGLQTAWNSEIQTAGGIPWTETKLQGKSIQACFVIGCLHFFRTAYSPSNEPTHSESVTHLCFEKLTSEKYCKLDIKNHQSSFKHLCQRLKFTW